MECKAESAGTQEGSAQAGVQVGQKRCHLILREAACEGGHHSLPLQDDAGNFGIGCGGATREFGVAEEVVEVGRDFLEREIVVAMTVGAADFIQVPAFKFLRSKRWQGMAAGKIYRRRDKRRRQPGSCYGHRFIIHDTLRM